MTNDLPRSTPEHNPHLAERVEALTVQSTMLSASLRKCDAARAELLTGCTKALAALQVNKAEGEQLLREAIAKAQAVHL